MNAGRTLPQRLRDGLIVPLVLACSAEEPAHAPCTARSEEALMYAATEESYLGLDHRQIASIVQVTDGSGPGGPMCTGVFVTDEWVVTAGHCFAIESPRVIVIEEGGAFVEFSVTERIPHPYADVALFQVSAPDSAEAHFRPIPVAASQGVDLSVGNVVDIAGYGLTEAGDTRELRFLSEPIVEVDDESFVVDGFGANGACLGDSGGPLIVRDRSGSVLVAGVLSTGSATCVDRDRYARLDALGDWVSGVVGSFDASDEACGGITEEGRCLYGSALFCEGERLVAEPCVGDTACGWHRAQRGFRCVEAARDPCFGVDSVGTCRDGAAWWCRGGKLEGEPCACGETCRVDGRTGGPRCAEPDAGQTG